MKRFFVSGYNKSGTTFVQMLLDAHPRVHCPSEQCFNVILRSVAGLCDDYERQIRRFDENTANQGVHFDRDRLFREVVRSAVLTQMDTGVAGPGTTHTGLNDNSILDNAHFWWSVFPEARFVFVVRDPRALAVSIWHHRQRTEPQFAESGVSADGVATALARSWPAHVDTLIEFARTHRGRAYIVRYEDLIGDRAAEHVSAMLRFLDLDGDEGVSRDMLARTDFGELQRKERERAPGGPGFFRQGSNRGWKTALSGHSSNALASRCRRQLERLGYLLDA